MDKEKDDKLKTFEVKEDWMKAFKGNFWSDGENHWAYIEKGDKTFQKFIWDPEKNKLNMGSHKMPLIAGGAAFFDKYAIEVEDVIHSKYDFSKKEEVQKEERYQLVGTADKVLFISFTERNDETRLISTRRADRDEKKMYHENRNQMLGIEPPNKKKDSKKKSRS